MALWLCGFVALYWGFRRNGEEKTPFRLIMLWDKFPKFTLGFIITSIALTFMLKSLEGEVQETALPAAISTLNRWWFAVAFVGIGLTTNVRKMWGKAVKSGIIQVYMLSNAIGKNFDVFSVPMGIKTNIRFDYSLRSFVTFTQMFFLRSVLRTSFTAKFRDDF